MQRTIGTVSRGVRAPIIRQGDDIAQIVIDSVLDAVKAENPARPGCHRSYRGRCSPCSGQLRFHR